MLQDGTESKEKADYFRLKWKVGGYRLNGLEKKHVQLLEQRKRDYMTGSGYTEDSGFVRAEGENGKLLVDRMVRKLVSANVFFCLYLNQCFSLFKSSRGAGWWCEQCSLGKKWWKGEKGG
jgi:hypothetical protein